MWTEDQRACVVWTPPVAKPRMTRRDRWMERPAVIRYRNFADILRLKVGRPLATDGMFIEFGIPMPASWSEKRKERAEGTPHQQRPDLSNLLKAVEDALNEKDEWIWQFRGLRKIWRREGYVYLQWPET